jgi:UDP-N-acetyl-2-amino-2-deoxyglucuronate dehydrogenase
VEEVFAYGTKSSSPIFGNYEYPSTSVTVLKYRDGKVGKCASVIDCWQPYYFHTHLVGSEGSLLDNKFQSKLLAGLGREHWNQLSFKPVDSGDVADHPYKTQFDRFFEAIMRGEEMPLTGLKDAVRTHEVIFASDLSLQTGRPVKLDELDGVGSMGAQPRLA